MTALMRRKDAAFPSVAFRGNNPHDLWQKAATIRREWLAIGLSTQPADRATAERALTRVYARLSRPRPRFEWVDSPYKALPLITGLPTLDELFQRIRDPRPQGPPPLASDLATLVSRLRGALSAGVLHADPELSLVRKGSDKRNGDHGDHGGGWDKRAGKGKNKGKEREPWPELPPLQALAAGVPFGVVLHQGVRTALHRGLATGFALPVRSALAGAGSAGEPVPVCWYGQQDASWVAYYDTLRRLGLASHGPVETDHLDDWAALARSCGWWWPGEQVCVVVERPATVQVEPVPGALHDEVRLRRDGVRYRDGWRPPLT